MNGFELRSIDTPLIRCDLQPCEDRWQRFVDVPALVTADDAAGPVHQSQVFLEIEQVDIGNFGRNNDQPRTGKRDAEPAPRSVLGTQREVMW